MVLINPFFLHYCFLCDSRLVWNELIWTETSLVFEFSIGSCIWMTPWHFKELLISYSSLSVWNYFSKVKIVIACRYLRTCRTSVLNLNICLIFKFNCIWIIWNVTICFLTLFPTLMGFIYLPLKNKAIYMYVLRICLFYYFRYKMNKCIIDIIKEN